MYKKFTMAMAPRVLVIFGRGLNPPLSSPFTASMARPSLVDVGLDNFEMLFRGSAPDVF